MRKNTEALSTLAFTLHRGPGQFALLLGSGVSRSSGIPTGWDVTVDLIRHLPNAPDSPDESILVNWYEKKFGQQPSYSALMASFARAQVERRNLLKPYFEPTDQEREDGLKIPPPLTMRSQVSWHLAQFVLSSPRTSIASLNKRSNSKGLFQILLIMNRGSMARCLIVILDV